jgi:predicted RNA-binding Zn-ribbon protein involved in translation (DUF1610 family)
MIPNKTLNRYIVGLIVLTMLVCVSASFVSAQDSEGPHVISGKVYTSDGDALTDPSGNIGSYNGSAAKVVLTHDGKKTDYEDDDGIGLGEDGFYWYVVTIPEGAWETDDVYRIRINGEKWGDEDYYCRGAGDKEIDEWKITSGGAERRDVQTVDYIPENIKPMLALIFAIVLAVFGVIVGIVRPARLAKRPKHAADLSEDVVIPVPVAEGAVPEAQPAKKAAETKKKAAAAAPAAAAPEEERTCETCSGRLEYIEEYDSWYCDKCGKYEGEEAEPAAEDEVPSLDEEPPAEGEPEAAAAVAETPAEEEKPAHEVKVCPQCGGNLEFVDDYDAYYCYTCQKYEEELTGEGGEPEGGGE